MSTTVNLTSQRPSYKALFALDTILASLSLSLLILASKPTLIRLRQRRFSTTPSYTRTHDGPLKTPLGTYFFLLPALLFLFIASLSRLICDILETSGAGISYDRDLGWNGRPAWNAAGNGYARDVGRLTFTTALATIFFTVLLNGGVWIHSSHVRENGTGITTPQTKSRIWNTFIMLAMLGTGVGAWGLGIEVKDSGNGGSLGQDASLSWSNVLSSDQATRIVWIVHEAIVIAASLSVSVEVLREFSSTNTNARDVSIFLFFSVTSPWKETGN